MNVSPNFKRALVWIGGLIIIAATALGAKAWLYAPTPPIAPVPIADEMTDTSSSKPALDKATLCRAGAFTPPLQDELDYSKEISKDASVKYLRTAINAYLEGTYTQGSHAGLMDGVHSPDSAYNELRQMDESYLRSKFLVLETDIAVGGGESIAVLFKDKPDTVFYVWVYEYIKEDGSHRGFDLRALTPTIDGAKDIATTQQIFINQICDFKMGI